MSKARCPLNVVENGSATGRSSRHKPSGATNTSDENASGRTAANSSASIAPVDDATIGAPAKPATSMISDNANTQSWMLRMSADGDVREYPGNDGATT